MATLYLLPLSRSCFTRTWTHRLPLKHFFIYFHSYYTVLRKRHVCECASYSIISTLHYKIHCKNCVNSYSISQIRMYTKKIIGVNGEGFTITLNMIILLQVLSPKYNLTLAVLVRFSRDYPLTWRTGGQSPYHKYITTWVRWRFFM